MGDVQTCETCEIPFCVDCDEDVIRCADNGWHCSDCNWRDCRPCAEEVIREERAEQADDIRRFGP